MEYMIEKTSRYGRDQLLDRPFGTVHSAYEHAVNIEVGGRLFCLQPAGSSMSPISLITNLSEAAFDDLKVAAGDFVRITKQEITIFHKGIPISFGRSEECIRELKLEGEERGYEENRRLKSYLEAWLKTDVSAGICAAVFGEAEDLLSREFRRILTHAEGEMKKKNQRQAAGWDGALLGLGIGLTPSGDDFLCGLLAARFMAGENCSELKNSITKQIRRSLLRTNKISGEFLRCAAEGQFGEAVHLLFSENICAGIEIMKKTGHSSGIDTLCGIVHGLEIQEIAEEESE